MSASPRITTVTDLWVYAWFKSRHFKFALMFIILSKITDVNDPEFRCYELDMVNTPGTTGTATVKAGSNVGFKADAVMGHPRICRVELSGHVEY